MRVDLGESNTIRKFIITGLDSDGTGLYPVDYTISVSSNGTDFNTVADVTNNGEGSGYSISGPTSNVITLTLNASTTGRYVKINITDATESDGTPVAAIAEFAVYEATSTEADWSDWSSALTSSGSAITSATGQYIQYKVTLATTDSSATPTLTSVSISSASDATAPSTISSVKDGTSADVDYTTSTTQLSANWTESTDEESAITNYYYAIGTSAGETDVVTWTDNSTNLSVTKTSLTLSSGTTYYFSVKAMNSVGLYSTPANSDGITVDTSAPSTIVTVNDGTGNDTDATNSKTTLSANWTASTDTESGIFKYYYAIGTTAGGTDVVNWTDNSTTRSVTVSALALTNVTAYYFSIKALNGAGLYSTPANSDGVIVNYGGAVPAFFPKITSVTPQYVSPGSDVTINGSGFLSGFSQASLYNIESGKIYLFMKFSGGTKIIVTLPDNTPTGLYDVIIQNTYAGSNKDAFLNGAIVVKGEDKEEEKEKKKKAEGTETEKQNEDKKDKAAADKLNNTSTNCPSSVSIDSFLGKVDLSQNADKLTQCLNKAKQLKLSWTAPEDGKYQINTKGSDTSPQLFVLNSDCNGGVINSTSDAKNVPVDLYLKKGKKVIFVLDSPDLCNTNSLVLNISNGVTTETPKGVETITQVPQAPQDIKIYTVQRGDSLYSIAQKLYGNPKKWAQIMNNNKDIYPSLFTNPAVVYSGWKLRY